MAQQQQQHQQQQRRENINGYHHLLMHFINPSARNREREKLRQLGIRVTNKKKRTPSSIIIINMEHV